MGLYARYHLNLPLLNVYPAMPWLALFLAAKERVEKGKHNAGFAVETTTPDEEKLHRILSHPNHKLRLFGEYRPENDKWVVRTDTFIGHNAEQEYESLEMDLKGVVDCLCGVMDEANANRRFYNSVTGMWHQNYYMRPTLQKSLLSDYSQFYSPSLITTQGIVPDFDMRDGPHKKINRQAYEYLAQFDDNRRDLVAHLLRHDRLENMNDIVEAPIAMKYIAFRPDAKRDTYSLFGIMPMRDITQFSMATSTKEVYYKMAMLDFANTHPILEQNVRAIEAQENLFADYKFWIRHHRPVGRIIPDEHKPLFDEGLQPN